ncbi:MAG: pyridoxal-phosphate-dependent aminotransferase family protein [Fusobacteriaceae bacterium]
MYKPNYLLMTAGPTMVRENVMRARMIFFGNPDLDDDFFTFYESVTNKIGEILNSKNSTNIVMSGEGMLGLDASCCSLIEKNDEVLVIGNGIFGDGFKDLVNIYGGNINFFKGDWKETISVAKLEEYILNSGKQFKCATVVHCDTPSGMLNDIKSICQLLNKYNILSIVDSVASMGGVKIDVDNWGIDILLGASQKVFSAPPGLTIISVSERAWKVIKNRQTPIISFYCNLLLWENCVENKLFPYTMPVSDIIALDVALDNILEYGIKNLIDEHEKIADYTRETLEKIGLQLYLEKGFSPTVTAFIIPEGYKSKEIIQCLKNEYNILISGSYGILKDKVLRIGHMGENIFSGRVEKTLDCLSKIFFKINK